jgi:hypothetical protein
MGPNALRQLLLNLKTRNGHGHSVDAAVANQDLHPRGGWNRSWAYSMLLERTDIPPLGITRPVSLDTKQRASAP